VSTLDQVHGIDAQRDQLGLAWKYFFEGKNAANGEPWVLVEELFEDRGVSGGTPFRQRPAAMRMIGRMNPGDAVIGAKLDRLFRNPADAHDTLVWFSENAWWLVVCDIGIDTRTPVGQMLVGILAHVAQFERSRLRERLREARQASKVRGDVYFNGKIPYGFKRGQRKDNRGKIRPVPDPYTRAIVQLFLHWHRVHGWTACQITRLCLYLRIRQRMRFDKQKNKLVDPDWTDPHVTKCMKREQALQELEKIRGPLCPIDHIEHVKFGNPPQTKKEWQEHGSKSGEMLGLPSALDRPHPGWQTRRRDEPGD
jgi:DNA invertase Pin-like site-specific DNA recombinase